MPFGGLFLGELWDGKSLQAPVQICMRVLTEKMFFFHEPRAKKRGKIERGPAVSRHHNAHREIDPGELWPDPVSRHSLGQEQNQSGVPRTGLQGMCSQTEEQAILLAVRTSFVNAAQ